MNFFLSFSCFYKVVLQRRFMFYFVFFSVIVVLSTFDLSSFYRCLTCRTFIGVWFIVVLSIFDLSSSCCDILFVLEVIKTDKTYLIS